MADHNYHDIHKQFAPSFIELYGGYPAPFPVCGFCAPYSDFNLHVWGEYLLPYVEGGTVYGRICFNAPNFSPISCAVLPGGGYTALNSGCVCCPALTGSTPAACTPTAKPIPAFVCPSSVRSSNPFTT